jgi:Protein of unknown function (DUF3618)
MAEPGGAVEVHGQVAVNGAVTTSDPEVLLAQIERTRADLARTIDSLADRVSPANNIRMLRDKVMQQIGRPEVQLGVAAVGLAVVGVVVIRAWARHRRAG